MRKEIDDRPLEYVVRSWFSQDGIDKDRLDAQMKWVVKKTQAAHPKFTTYSWSQKWDAVSPIATESYDKLRRGFKF